MNTKRNPVGWFEIYVQDMERAKNFYQKTFEVTLEHLESPDIEMWAFPPLMQPENPGCTGAIVKMEGKEAISTSLTPIWEGPEPSWRPSFSTKKYSQGTSPC